MRERIIYGTGAVPIARYVDGELVYVAQDVDPDRHNGNKQHVMPDIQPYRSMIDGSVINSRSRHREHLRDHGCVEVGNDSSVKNPRRKPLSSPPGLKDAIIKAVHLQRQKRRS